MRQITAFIDIYLLQGSEYYIEMLSFILHRVTCLEIRQRFPMRTITGFPLLMEWDLSLMNSTRLGIYILAWN